MENKNGSKGKFSRRKFVGGTAALAAVSLVPFGLSSCNNPAQAPATAPSPAKPGSNFGGVQIGAITYSWRSMPGGVENIIKYCNEAGLTSVELMSGDVEEFLGAPKNPMMAFFAQPPASQKKPVGPNPGGPPPQGPRPGAPAAGGRRSEFKFTPEQEAAIKKYNEDVKAWRLGIPIAKFEEVKKMFDDAGIAIHIVKFSPARWSDEEVDYAFKAAKALGAKGVTEEIGEEAVKKLGPVAEKHGLFAIFHNHMQFEKPEFSYDTFMAVSPAVMFNFDAGHFFGSTGLHPNTIIEKYHDRIVSIHLKDKTGPKTDPANNNQVWGQGETPVAEILQLIQKNKWPIYVDIELEYEIKPWSNAVKETKICKEYARQILM